MVYCQDYIADVPENPNQVPTIFAE